jgi:hypothetical protein
MNWKGGRRKRSLPDFKVLSQHSPGKTEEKYENLSQNNRSSCRDLNLGPPGYRVLTTQP